MFEPAKDRNPLHLHPEFLKRVQAYCAAVNHAFPSYYIALGEGRRTLTRQRWLYSLGRTWWTRHFKVVTWTLNSMHRWGLADDLVLTTRSNRSVALWDTRLWQHIYAVMPPSKYGLETLVPIEYNHVQIQHAEHVVATKSLSGLVQT